MENKPELVIKIEDNKQNKLYSFDEMLEEGGVFTSDIFHWNYYIPVFDYHDVSIVRVLVVDGDSNDITIMNTKPNRCMKFKKMVNTKLDLSFLSQ
jgi:hypothetical protein